MGIAADVGVGLEVGEGREVDEGRAREGPRARAQRTRTMMTTESRGAAEAISFGGGFLNLDARRRRDLERRARPPTPGPGVRPPPLWPGAASAPPGGPRASPAPSGGGSVPPPGLRRGAASCAGVAGREIMRRSRAGWVGGGDGGVDLVGEISAVGRRGGAMCGSGGMASRGWGSTGRTGRTVHQITVWTPTLRA